MTDGVGSALGLLAPEMWSLIAGVLPGLSGSEISTLASGWDSNAFAVEGRIVIKVPKHAKARERLRREAALLALVRPKLTLPVPDLHLVEGPPLFSWHEMLRGEQVQAADYHRLPEGARDRLGRDLGRFLAELHRVGVPAARDAGAVELAPWTPPGEVLSVIHPMLPPGMAVRAERVVADFVALPPDPLGQVYGHFDSHGWNMAFDPVGQVLNGVYDFADSGIGPRHQEFIYAGLVSFDLMGRVVRAYEAEAGLALDPARIATVAGMHRLWELAEGAGTMTERAAYVARFADWCAAFGE